MYTASIYCVVYLTYIPVGPENMVYCKYIFLGIFNVHSCRALEYGILQVYLQQQLRYILTPLPGMYLEYVKYTLGCTYILWDALGIYYRI